MFKFLSLKDLIFLKMRANEIVLKDLAEYPLYYINNLLKYFENGKKLLEFQLNYNNKDREQILKTIASINLAIDILKRELRMPRLDK